MTNLARGIDAIPYVATSAERGFRFPNPTVNQRVQNGETGRLERWTGAAWVADDIWFAASGVINVKDPAYGAVGDGVTDDTAAIQAAIDAANAAGGGTVHTPLGEYLVDPLLMRSNVRWELDAGVIIRANPGYVDGGFPIGASDVLVSFIDVSNAVIDGYGARFIMGGSEYVSGEFRHCFDLRGTTNVTILGVSAEDSGGDGFVMNKSTLKAYCENTRLVDVKADGNRRQGISVISAKNCWIERPVLINTAGADPQAGIDIEPDVDPTNEIDGVWVIDPFIDNNVGSGVLIALFNWMENITTDKRVDISIIRPRISNVNAGIAIVGGDLGAGITLSGRIDVIGALTSDTNTFGVGVQDWPKEACPVRIIDPTVVRPNEAASASGLFGAAYAVYRESGATTTQTIGNVSIVRPSLIDDRNTPLVTRFLFAQDAAARAVSAVNLEDVTVESPMQVVGPTAGPDVVFDGAGVFTDPLALIVNNVSGNETVTFSSYTPLTTNAAATGAVTVSLSVAVAPDAPLRTFRVDAAHELRIDPDGTSTIRFGGATAGQYIYSSDLGASVTLRRSSTTSWDVVAMTGEWFVEGAAAYTPTNVTTDRAFDADTVAVAELADVVGTLIADLKAKGIVL